jgi:hypothetical protein
MLGRPNCPPALAPPVLFALKLVKVAKFNILDGCSVFWFAFSPVGLAMRTYRFRCYLFQQQDGWVASCLDLSLRVRCPSAEQARTRLEEVICDYVSDHAVTGDDPGTTVPRPVPLSEWADFYRRTLYSRVRRLGRRPDSFQGFEVTVSHKGYKLPTRR